MRFLVCQDNIGCHRRGDAPMRGTPAETGLANLYVKLHDDLREGEALPPRSRMKRWIMPEPSQPNYLSTILTEVALEAQAHTRQVDAEPSPYRSAQELMVCLVHQAPGCMPMLCIRPYAH